MAEPDNRGQRSFIQYIGMLFCFFIFPLFVINSSLVSLLELRLENHRQLVFAELTGHLKQLAPYDDERKYFHHILKRIFKLASQSSDYTAYLEKAITRLRHNHPGRLEFIVWNKNGQLIEHLTDEKRYRFVIKKLWEVLSATTSHIQQNDLVPIKDLEAVKNNLNLVKQFLGRVFLPETLRMPFINNDSASIILADYGHNRPYFWYHTGPAGGILCFISWDAIKDSKGLKNIVTALNQKKSDITTGFASLHNMTEPFTDGLTQFKNEVVMSLAKFERSSEQMIETTSMQIVVQMLNPHTRIFSYKIKEGDIYFPDQVRQKILVQFAGLYLLGIGLIYINFYLRKAFFSLRWKLLLLFLYANTAPLVILGAIAYDFVQNKAISLRNDKQLESARLLRDIDTRFSTLLEEYTGSINNVLNKVNSQTAGKLLTAEQIQKLQEELELFEPSEIFLVDQAGKILIAVGEGGKNIRHSTTYVKNMADAMLKYHNRIIVQADKSDVLSKIAAPEHSDFIRNSIQDCRKLWPISIGETIKLGYWNLIGVQKAYINNYFVLLLWDENKFQNIFLRQNFMQLINKHPEMKIYARIQEQNILFPAASESHAIEAVLTAADRAGSVIHNTLIHNGQEYYATAMHGKKLNQTSLTAMFPARKIADKIAQLQRNILSGAFFSVLLTTIISLAFARQFLEPVKTLSIAAKAVENHDFRHRISIRDKDEFGHLGQVMNRMIEGLGELEIAKVVQESLFPEESPQVAPFMISGKCFIKTSLGGNYYDFIQIDAEHFGVIIGDVSGHGISAALIMAMAKAGVKMADRKEIADPAALLAAVNKIIYSLKSCKLRRMMTFQYLVININSGEARLANAGHCYPLLLNKKTGQSRYIEKAGVALGVSSMPDYETFSFLINADETLLMFTGGLVEATNAAGQSPGYSVFADLALKNLADQPEASCQQIYDACERWAGSINEDATMIAIRRQEKEHG